MLGLRLVREGVPFARFAETHGQTLRAALGPVWIDCKMPACWNWTGNVCA